MPDVPLVVIDTNVWIEIIAVQRLEKPTQPYWDIFEALFAAKFIPVYCRETLNELLLTISSRHVATKYGFTPTVITFAQDFFTQIFYGAGRFVTIDNRVRPMKSKDDKFVELALVSRAKFLVTEDNDFQQRHVKALLQHGGVTLVWPPGFKSELDRWAGLG